MSEPGKCSPLYRTLVLDPSGIKILVVALTFISGGHDQWTEGKYLSGQCKDEAMALAIRFKRHPIAGIEKIEIDCLREDEYERRENEIRRGGRGEDSGHIHSDE